MERMPAARSAATSCTAPNACDATPHSANARMTAASCQVHAAPASTRPYTAGEKKWMLLHTESANGTSLSRSGGALYATTKNRLAASTNHDHGDPTMTRNTTNGAHRRPAVQSVAR